MISILGFAVAGLQNVPKWQAVYLSTVPTFALEYGIFDFFKGDENVHLPLEKVYLFLLLEVIVWGVATWYASQVVPQEYGVRKNVMFPLIDSAKYVQSSARNVMRPPVLSSSLVAGVLSGLACLSMISLTLVPMGAVCLAQETFECDDK